MSKRRAIVGRRFGPNRSADVRGRPGQGLDGDFSGVAGIGSGGRLTVGAGAENAIGAEDDGGEEPGSRTVGFGAAAGCAWIGAGAAAPGEEPTGAWPGKASGLID